MSTDDVMIGYEARNEASNCQNRTNHDLYLWAIHSPPGDVSEMRERSRSLSIVRSGAEVP